MKPQRLLSHPAVAALCERHGSHPHPEELVKTLTAELLAEAPEVPVDLEVLASVRNIRRPQVVEMSEAGSIHFDGKSYVVRLRASDSPQRRRFTLAHEIMHTYFNVSTKSHADAEVGHFTRRDAEEYLCDFGAGELLFPRQSFKARCPTRPSMTMVLELADEFDASIEATARRVVTTATHDAHLVVLEPKLTLVQQRALRRNEIAPTLDGLEPEPPTPELRVNYAASNTDLFIPTNKSVDDDCPLARVIECGAVDYTGSTGLVAQRNFLVTAMHLPVSQALGSRVNRVIALLYAPEAP